MRIRRLWWLWGLLVAVSAWGRSCDSLWLQAPHEIVLWHKEQPLTPQYDTLRQTWFVLLPQEGYPLRALTASGWQLWHEGQCQQGAALPLWVSIIPPLLAIGLAFLLRQVIVSLSLAVIVGLWLAFGLTGQGFIKAFLAFWDQYLIRALNDPGHLSVIVFSLLIGGMVSLLTRTGLMHALMELLGSVVRTARGAQIATWFAGVIIFFDDYANTLVIGNTMRPITDRFRVSREKLAYIVDSTAAPVAAIAFVTTWIGAELGYIQEALNALGIQESPYSIFMTSIKYAFYPFFALFLILVLAWLERDYGPMLHAERRARRGRVAPDSAMEETLEEESNHDHPPLTGLLALLPVLLLIGVTIWGLWYTGYQGPPQPGTPWWIWIAETIGNGDAYRALLWGSGIALTFTILMVWVLRFRTLERAFADMIKGFEALLPAIIILVLAWTLATVLHQLHTAHFFASWLQGQVTAQWMPLLIFLTAALTAFATGTSWGTMAILYPLVLPLVWKMSLQAGFPHDIVLEIFAAAAAAVLGGAVFGDHCSPISDTTILSALASRCPLIDHVRTQLPYALTAATIATLMYTLWGLTGIPAWIFILAGLILVFLVVRILGIPVNPLETYQAPRGALPPKK